VKEIHGHTENGLVSASLGKDFKHFLKVSAKISASEGLPRISSLVAPISDAQCFMVEVRIDEKVGGRLW